VENEFVKQTEKQLLQEIVRGAQLAFENAEKLYQEAQLLGSNGAFARALTLHQISMEECSKVDMLGNAAISLVLGHPVDINKLAARFRQHKVKNYNNTYMSVTTDAEREARKSGDPKRAIEIFKAQQAILHHWLNTNKNASLYVDYLDGQFISPTERITEELAVQFQGLNAFFLSQGSNHLGVLNKVVNDPDAVAMQAKELLGRLEELKTIGRELDEEFQEIVDAWLDEQAGKAREVAGGS
jgi:AbiV family abortive infection protein